MARVYVLWIVLVVYVNRVRQNKLVILTIFDFIEDSGEG